MPFFLCRSGRENVFQGDGAQEFWKCAGGHSTGARNLGKALSFFGREAGLGLKSSLGAVSESSGEGLVCFSVF